MATAAVAKRAHEKSAARKKSYNDQMAQRAKEIYETELSLAEKRKKAIELIATQTAQRIAEQRKAEEEAKKEIEKKQQEQMLIVGGLALVSVGFLIYSIKK
jgi:hypothetical protein